MRFTDMKIGTRLSCGFGAMLLLLAGVATLGLNGMQQANAALEHVVTLNVKKMELLEDMATSVHIVSRVARTVALLTDQGAIHTEYQKILTARQQYNQALQTLEQLPIDTDGRALLARIQQARDVARPLNDQFIELAKQHQEQAVPLLLTKVIPATSSWLQLLDEYTELQRAKSAQDSAAGTAAYEQASRLMLVVSALALMAGASLAWWLTRSIARPLGDAVRIARTVAEGDLSSRIEVHSRDETGQLLDALKSMNASLAGIVGRVRAGTETIATASEQISQGNLDLSVRTEQQAGSLEETASSMEELTSAVQHSAAHAQQASQMAVAAAEVAHQGGDIVAQVVQTMGAIHAASNKIAEIISVIDGIAFQTNILALNAAVEAARAGEQGRGFAVVASEVRNLAQRSAAAAKEIKSLINDSVDQVSLGSKLVDQAGLTMGNIVQEIRGVAEIMTEISAAAQEQTAGIEQVNQAVIQMDEMTQQNAALVEEAAAATVSLRDQAGELAQMVGMFILSTAATSAPAQATARRAPAVKAAAAALPRPALPLATACHS